MFITITPITPSLSLSTVEPARFNEPLYNEHYSSARPQLLNRVVSYTLLQCLEVVISSFEPFPSDFEGGLLFLHLEGVGGSCRKRRPLSISLIIEDLVISYTSKVEIPVSSYF